MVAQVGQETLALDGGQRAVRVPGVGTGPPGFRRSSGLPLSSASGGLPGIAAGKGAMLLVHPLDGSPRAARRAAWGADLLRLRRNPLLGLGTAVDPRGMAVRGQADVGHQRPEAPPAQDGSSVVSGWLLEPEALGTDAPHRKQDLSTGLGPPAVPKCPMRVQVGHHPFRDERRKHVVAGERRGLVWQEFGRERELHLAREAGIAPAPAHLDPVPQPSRLFPVSSVIPCWIAFALSGRQSDRRPAAAGSSSA